MTIDCCRNRTRSRNTWVVVDGFFRKELKTTRKSCGAKIFAEDWLQVLTDMRFGICDMSTLKRTQDFINKFFIKQ